MNYDEQEVRKSFDIISSDFTEVRILKDRFTASGYFSNADCLLSNLKKYANQEGLNFYIVLNKIDDACYSRKAKDCFVEMPKETTADANIIGRQWLMIDIDCERAKGVSSTKEELKKARSKALTVYGYLGNRGFEKPVVALSGNGYHLLYKIDLDNGDASKKLVNECLIALDIMFSDESVKIDTAVFNAARITKLYGTLAQKGQNTEERPHRLSKIIEIPVEIKVTDSEVLINLAKTIPEAPKEARKQFYGSGEQFDLDSWLSKHGVRISKEGSFSGARKLLLEECPFNSEHRGNDAAIFVMNNGAIGFKCLHNSCSNYTWQDVRKKYEPDAYDIKERLAPRVNSQKPKEEPAPNEPFFYTATTVKAKSRDSIVSIRTGVRDLDRRIIGLNKGEISCLSGVNSSGKSSFLSQVAIEVAQHKYRVALFSGELEENRVLNWIQLQAAGKQFTRPTQYEDYYTVQDDTKKLINAWIDDKLYIYNNRKGNDIFQVLDRVSDCIKQNKVDLIILDNLMAMDISGITGDKYEKQSSFIKSVKVFARDNDVHVILVAHPRKTIGFLRKEDISGTADLTNVVDNVFIVHRVNSDFIRLSKQMFGWNEGHDLYNFSNVIEVCKNRDLGIQDLFVGLHYETQSKRFLNDKYEVKHFDWELSLEDKLPFDI